MSVTTATRLAAGLFGKLSAHGDFVDRGWPNTTVAAIDGWLSAAMAAARTIRDDMDFDAWMRAAPMWEGYVPAGLLGPLALRIMLAPSVDRAGRLFPLVAGVAGDDASIWGHGRATPDLGALVYEAVAGRLDADAMFVRLSEAAGAAGEGVRDTAPPTASVWWPASVEPGEASPLPPIRASIIDTDLLERLMAVQP